MGDTFFFNGENFYVKYILTNHGLGLGQASWHMKTDGYDSNGKKSWRDMAKKKPKHVIFGPILLDKGFIVNFLNRFQSANFPILQGSGMKTTCCRLSPEVETVDSMPIRSIWCFLSSFEKDILN